MHSLDDFTLSHWEPQKEKLGDYWNIFLLWKIEEAGDSSNSLHLVCLILLGCLTEAIEIDEIKMDHINLMHISGPITNGALVSRSAGRNPNAEWVKQICIEAQVQGSARGWTVLKLLQTAGENYASRGRRSGEQSQSVTKPRTGRRPEQRAVQSKWRGMKQASINERFSAPGLVGRLPGEPTGRESQAGRAGLEGTHNMQNYTTQKHYSATRETCNKREKITINKEQNKK